MASLSTWTVDQLDPKRLFEVVPNTDPETSSRFSLPVPNWLDESGAPKWSHPNIRQIEKRGRLEWRYVFKNYEDFCDQAVKIDGSGTLIIAGPTLGQSARIIDLVYKTVGHISDLTPEKFSRILETTLEEMGLQDRYNDDIENLTKKMKPVEGTRDFLGPYTYNEERLPISASIYLEGCGHFKGPTAEPQHFEKGAFVTFPGMTIAAARKYIKNYDPHNDNSIQAKLVSKAVFLRSRRDKNHLAINLDKIQGQVEPVRHYKKIQPLGGFPELSPEFASVQKQWIDNISSIYSSYGFTPLDTREIEELDTLLEQGEDSNKEIFLVKSRSKQQEAAKDRQLALRFDLTVPTARYVAQNFSKLEFPFRRQQISKVHRADNPNQGRYREFYQCDVDVIDTDNISIEYDAEMPRIMYDVTEAIGLDGVEIGINNRKIYQGFFQELGVEDGDIVDSVRILDKLPKIGAEGVISRLSEEIGLSSTVIDKSLQLSSIKEYDRSFADRVMALGCDNELIRQGVEELSTVMRRLEDLPYGYAAANLSIARGLDYYSGTVFEGHIKQFPECPAILAGGRYDSLVSRFMARKLPGVGISFGLTRVFNFLADKNILQAGPQTPTKVLVAHKNNGHEDIQNAMQSRELLRARGINAEILYSDLYNQMSYANRKGIPYVLFHTENPASPHEIRDMRRSTQAAADLSVWRPQ